MPPQRKRKAESMTGPNKSTFSRIRDSILSLGRVSSCRVDEPKTGIRKTSASDGGAPLYTLRSTTKHRIASLQKDANADGDPKGFLKLALENETLNHTNLVAAAPSTDKSGPIIEHVPPANKADEPEENEENPAAAKPSFQDLSIADFEVGRQLGRGHWGKVFLARHRPTSFICALKMLNKQHIRREKSEPLIRRELEVHQNLAHPHILRLLAWFHDRWRVYLVLEYAIGGNLYDKMHAQPGGFFEEKVAARLVAQTAMALQYMHAKNIMHRDLKPENILLGLQDEVKLADFGYSIHSSSGKRETICGTLDYLSPEMVDRAIKKKMRGEKDGPLEGYDHRVDLWSLGVLAYELCAGKPPFYAPKQDATRRKIRNFKGPLMIKGRSVKLWDFINKLITANPEDRMSFEDALKHPWIVQNCNK